MADTVTVNSIRKLNELTVTLTCLSDATGETNVVKVDKSALLLGSAEPSALHVMSITANVQGFTSVTLAWDHTADQTIAVLGAGSFFEDYREEGGLKSGGSGGTGDILLSSAGAGAGDSYTIVLRLRLV